MALDTSQAATQCQQWNTYTSASWYNEFLVLLQDLWINDNKVQDMEGLLARLDDVGSTLTCLYANNNPATADPSDFRRRCLQQLFKLEQLDDKLISR